MGKETMVDSQERSVIEDFDKKFKTYLGSYSGRSSTAHSFTIRRQRVCEMMEDIKGGRVLDIGCGPGIMVGHLLDKGFEFYGVDISSKMIDQCKKRFSNFKSAHFSIGKIGDLKFPDAFFDVVICMGVVEYIDDDTAALKETSRVLKPGGVIIITLPNRLNPYRIWNRFILNRRILALIKRYILRKRTAVLIHREYKEKDYRRLLASHRLNMVDVSYYNFNIMLFPFDRLLPNFAVSISERLEPLCRSRLRFLGTGFIIKAKKV